MGRASRSHTVGQFRDFLRERLDAPTADQVFRELGLDLVDDPQGRLNTLLQRLEAGCPQAKMKHLDEDSLWKFLLSHALVGFWYVNVEHRRRGPTHTENLQPDRGGRATSDVGQSSRLAGADDSRDASPEVQGGVQAIPVGPRPSVEAHPTRAVLALVVPSSKAQDLGDPVDEARPLDLDRTLELLGSVSYYVCLRESEVKKLEDRLVSRRFDPSTTLEEDVYLRLEVDPGTDLIGQKLFGLKTALRDGPRRTVLLKTRRSLAKLTGLEAFEWV
jgi:hypothetical protein